MDTRQALPLSFVLALVACDRPPVHRDCDRDATVACPLQNDPLGRIEGSIVYDGPPPTPSSADPTVAGGRIVLLLFDAHAPPPPRGTATTAISFQTLAASRFFAGAIPQSDGRVHVSAPFAFPGIPRAGVFELRAFYSHADGITYTAMDGTTVTAASGFDPVYGVRSQPVDGDVVGGALIDPSAAMPLFARIPVGNALGSDGGETFYTLPVDGAVTRGVTVFIGQVLATERPMFHVATTAVTVPGPGGPVTLPPPQGFTVDVVPPLDATATASPDAFDAYARATGLLPAGAPVLRLPRNPVIAHPDTGQDLPSFSAIASLDDDECVVAALGGVRCAPMPLASIGFFELAFDRNANGTIDVTPASGFADVHPTLATTNPAAAAVAGRVPWLFPLVVLQKLHEPNAGERAALAGALAAGLPADRVATLRAAFNRVETLDVTDPMDPRYPVVLFGTVVPGGDPANLLLEPWATGHRDVEPYVRLALVPVAIELHGPDLANDGVAIVTPATHDAATLAQPFLPAHYRCAPFDAGAAPDDPTLQAGVPTGRYAVTLVGPSGQTWTLPDELAGFPAPSNATGALCAGGVCAAPTQSLVVRIEGAVAPPAGVTLVCPDPPSR